MTYRLRDPLFITDRLLVGFRAGDAVVSVNIIDQQGDGRMVYRWFVDFDDSRSFEGDDLKSGCQGGDIVDGLSSLCCFLSAFADAHGYRAFNNGEPGENGDLFPEELAEWAMANSGDIAYVGQLIDEARDLEEPVIVEV